jgi:hypothetical protein
MFSHDTVINHYKVNFALMQHHKYSLTELENMIPWEKYVYIDLLTEHLKKLEQDRRDREAAAKYKKRR